MTLNVCFYSFHIFVSDYSWIEHQITQQESMGVKNKIRYYKLVFLLKHNVLVLEGVGGRQKTSGRQM